MILDIYKITKINIFILIGLFYSYITSYFATVHSGFINPKNLFFILMIITSISLYLNKSKLLFFKMPIFKWILIYFSMILLWYMFPTNHLEVAELRKMIFSLFFLFFIIMLISLDNDTFYYTRGAILLATIIAVVSNVYEFFNPTAFYSSLSGLHIIGRSAGLYINSNISGEAIVLGLLFSYGIVPTKFKYVFLLVTFIGILLTFSRTGMISWFIVIFFFIKENIIKKNKAIIFIGIFFVILTLTTPILLEYISNNFGKDSSNLINRLNFISGNTTKVDDSQEERIMIAQKAFNYFADNPLLGAGLGYTKHWELRVSPHNMYLLLMIQFGIVGAFLYPLLIYSSVYKAKNEAKKLSKPFASYLLIIGFTTHNVLDAYHLLIALGLMANMSFRSHKKII